MVPRQQAIEGFGLETVNDSSRDESHRGPRDRAKPHVSGGSEDSRHGLFEVSEHTDRAKFSHV